MSDFISKKCSTYNNALEFIEQYDKNSKIVDYLIKDLRDNNTSWLIDFLEDKSMIKLLYITYRHIPNIPKSRAEFYENIYNTVFLEEDLLKNRKSTASKEYFLEILSELSFFCIKTNNLSFTETKLTELAKHAIKSLTLGYENANIDISKIVLDVINFIPFFHKTTSDIKWIHKSFTEYFVAYYIALNKKNKIIDQILNSNNIFKYINIIDFYFDLNGPGAKRDILYKIICKYINDYNNSKTCNNQVISLCLDLKKALESEIKEEDVALEILVNDF